jgi:hypothetical protein
VFGENTTEPFVPPTWITQTFVEPAAPDAAGDEAPPVAVALLPTPATFIVNVVPAAAAAVAAAAATADPVFMLIAGAGPCASVEGRAASSDEAAKTRFREIIATNLYVPKDYKKGGKGD